MSEISRWNKCAIVILLCVPDKPALNRYHLVKGDRDDKLMQHSLDQPSAGKWYTKPYKKYLYLPDTLTESPASMTPLLGRTQYRRGAVVLTLKHTFLSVGLPNFRVAVTTSVNGPGQHTDTRQTHTHTHIH